MNVCSATCVLCRTTPQWLVWMIGWWPEPSMLTSDYLITDIQPASSLIGEPPATDTDFAAADRALFPRSIGRRRRSSWTTLSAPRLWRIRNVSADDNLVGHIGAYFAERLACGLAITTAGALRRPFKQPRGARARAASYKHVQGGSDTELYAEMSAGSAHLRSGSACSSFGPS
jgi:hypothetical protein